MRLLFDEPLAESVCGAVADLFPGSLHVRLAGLQGARDETIWQFARDESLTLVSKDGDFHRLAVMKGSPPKFVWIRTGNCRTSEVVALLRRHRQEIAAFIEQEEATVLELG